MDQTASVTTPLHSSRIVEFVDKALSGSKDDPDALLKRMPVAFAFGLLTPLMVRHGLPDAVAYAPVGIAVTELARLSVEQVGRAVDMVRKSRGTVNTKI